MLNHVLSAQFLLPLWTLTNVFLHICRNNNYYYLRNGHHHNLHDWPLLLANISVFLILVDVPSSLLNFVFANGLSSFVAGSNKSNVHADSLFVRPKKITFANYFCSNQVSGLAYSTIFHLIATGLQTCKDS
ncbi:unnamed protein product [Callosobruchus maculatus]|uniref:Uncharacterized protein n=1 Tax=Callosobruchus maculatus TaxID=64391 RepID=A0A653CVD4_CALMS|nr:unnamed protein product [Callosobruchus maculatus]